MINTFFLVLLPLVSSLASSPSSPISPPNVTLVEIWDCGPEASKFLSKLAEATLSQCPALKDGVNMCCKNHDFCYAMHKENNQSHGFCDFKFCGCLQDAQDIYDISRCGNALTAACKLVKSPFGTQIYSSSNPKNSTQLAEKYNGFVDARPLGLDMQTLVDTCGNAKGMAIHCHNSAHRCLQRNDKSFHSNCASVHDCRSIMYECLQILSDSNATVACTSLARQMCSKLVKVFDVDESLIGKQALEVYPIISARLFKDCSNATRNITACLKAFDMCASENREERPEHFFNAARRIDLGCHRGLRECLDKMIVIRELPEVVVLYPGENLARLDEGLHTPQEHTCMDARSMAVARIREDKYREDSWWAMFKGKLADKWTGIKHSPFAQYLGSAWDSVTGTVGNIFG